MIPVLWTPYDKPLDVELMEKTGKCSRCHIDLMLLNVELDLMQRKQIYFYRCASCEAVFSTYQLMQCNLPN